jgi:cystathionine beta-lyase
VTLTSATKAFNIAGLRCGAMHFGAASLRERFLCALPLNLLGPVNSVGLDATIAAWDAGQPWLDAVLLQLHANRDRLAERLRADLPGIRHYPPESTYLAWLDCRDLDLPVPPAQFFLEEARVALRSGADFGPQAASCLRLTFATAPDILDAILDRMTAAAGRRRR